MNLLRAVKPFLQVVSLLLLIAGIGGLLLGLGPKFCGHVGDPDDDFIKIAAVGAACVAAAVVLDRMLKRVPDAPGDNDRRGFPVVVDDKPPHEG